MKKAIVGKKIGMTQVFTEDGRLVPVTVIEAGPCTVVQTKTQESDGYEAVQVGFVAEIGDLLKLACLYQLGYALHYKLNGRGVGNLYDVNTVFGFILGIVASFFLLVIVTFLLGAIIKVFAGDSVFAKIVFDSWIFKLFTGITL